MRRALLRCSLLLAVLAASGCKPDDECELHCGPCGGDPPLANDTLSPVRYGSDSQGVPVVELLYEAQGTCREDAANGGAAKVWMSWKAGAPAIGAPGPKLDTSTASLEYLSDLHNRAIVWHNVDLMLPYDETWGAFTFRAIEGGKQKGTFRCAPSGGVIACKSAD